MSRSAIRLLESSQSQELRREFPVVESDPFSDIASAYALGVAHGKAMQVAVDKETSDFYNPHTGGSFMNFQRFYAGQSPILVAAPTVNIRKRSLGFTNALMGYFPDAVAVALFWEPDAKCIGFKFLSKRERGDYALRAQVGKRTRYVFCDLFFKKYGLSEHQGDFEPVMVPGSSDIDCFIALVNAPSVSTSPKPADARPPAPANPEPTPARPRVPKWDKSYTLIQAIEVASLCVQGLGTAHAAERASVSLRQAHEIRNTWGTAEDVAELKERLERTR